MYINLGSKCPESGAIYAKTIQQIEKWSNIIRFVIADVTPVCFMLPKCIVSLFMYITTDLGTVELELPLPMW